MAYIQDELPPDYEPYPSLEICSNEFSGVKIPIAIAGQPVLLVGISATPLVWLSAPSAPNSMQWNYVVRASRTTNPYISVVRKASMNGVIVKAGDAIILDVLAASQTRAIVRYLNFSPLGLHIKGDPRGMTIGGVQFSKRSAIGAVIGFNLSLPAGKFNLA